jgi:hypothetical protein
MRYLLDKSQSACVCVCRLHNVAHDTLHRLRCITSFIVSLSATFMCARANAHANVAKGTRCLPSTRGSGAQTRSTLPRPRHTGVGFGAARITIYVHLCDGFGMVVWPSTEISGRVSSYNDCVHLTVNRVAVLC